MMRRLLHLRDLRLRFEKGEVHAADVSKARADHGEEDARRADLRSDLHADAQARSL